MTLSSASSLFVSECSRSFFLTAFTSFFIVFVKFVFLEGGVSSLFFDSTPFSDTLLFFKSSDFTFVTIFFAGNPPALSSLLFFSFFCFVTSLSSFFNLLIPILRDLLLPCSGSPTAFPFAVSCSFISVFIFSARGSSRDISTFVLLFSLLSRCEDSCNELCSCPAPTVICLTLSTKGSGPGKRVLWLLFKPIGRFSRIFSELVVPEGDVRLVEGSSIPVKFSLWLFLGVDIAEQTVGDATGGLIAFSWVCFGTLLHVWWFEGSCIRINVSQNTFLNRPLRITKGHIDKSDFAF